MKKKIALLGILTFGVAITSYSVSGTYAKYVEVLSADKETATVAKFQLGDDHSSKLTFKLFDTAYTGIKGDGTTIAPGAKGTKSFTIDPSDWTIETNYKVQLSASVTNNDNIPIKFKVTGNDVDGSPISDSGNHDITELGTVLSEQLKLNNKVFKPDEKPENLNFAIEWEWAFGREGFTSEGSDSTDTGLGNTGTATVDVTLSLAVAQTQTEAGA